MSAGAPSRGRFRCAASSSAAKAGRTLLVPFIPIAVVLELTHASASLVFSLRPRRHPDRRADGPRDGGARGASGPGIGGFLNVTFGNAPELIIAFFALNEGLQEVVKASLVGSILGNVLLVMGAAMLVGGLKRERQRFDRTAAKCRRSLLVLAVGALIMPAVFELVRGTGLPNPTAQAVNYDSDVEKISIGTAVILLATYIAGPLLLPAHHKDLFNPPHAEDDHVGERVAGASARHDARHRRRRGRRDVEILVGSITEASALDRPVALLRRHHRRGDRRRRGGALGGRLLRHAATRWICR